MDWLIFGVSTWFGVGLVPVIATFIAVTSTGLLYRCIAHSRALLLTTFALIIGAGFWASHQSGELTGVTDDGRTVVDEVAGVALMLTLAGTRAYGPLAALLVGFILLDGLKPWPMSQIEKAPGAIGVMGDDMVLGLIMGTLVLSMRHIIVSRRSP